MNGACFGGWIIDASGLRENGIIFDQRNPFRQTSDPTPLPKLTQFSIIPKWILQMCSGLDKYPHIHTCKSLRNINNPKVIKLQARQFMKKC